MVVELAYFGGNFAYLPAFQIVARVQDVPILLLEAPQFCVCIESCLKMSLPAFVSNLWQISVYGSCAIN